jgi:hypothetical protein
MNKEKQPPIDGNGVELNIGDRAFAYDFTGEKVFGRFEDNEYKHVSEWAVAYDDGETCAVLDLRQLWKIK